MYFLFENSKVIRAKSKEHAKYIQFSFRYKLNIFFSLEVALKNFPTYPFPLGTSPKSVTLTPGG